MYLRTTINFVVLATRFLLGSKDRSIWSMLETMWNSDRGFSRPWKSCRVYDTRFSYTECTGWVEGEMWKTVKPIEQNKIEWKVYVFYMDGKVFFLFFFCRERETRESQRGSQLAKWKAPMKFEASGVGIFDTLCLYREIVRIIVKFGWIFASNENWKIVQPFSFSSRRGNGLASVCVLHKYIDDNWNFLFLINVCFNSTGFALSFLLLSFIEQL